MALIDKETIRAEIERLKIAYRSSDNLQDAIRYDEITDLLAFLDSLPEQPIEGMEEAAHNFAIYYDNGTCDGIAQDCFIAGAEWQKDKMMEEAVDGKVFMSFAPGHNQMVMADVDLPTNTKVKVIIVKEDEK